jgi:hypothetical protein
MKMSVFISGNFKFGSTKEYEEPTVNFLAYGSSEIEMIMRPLSHVPLCLENIVRSSYSLGLTA